MSDLIKWFEKRKEVKALKAVRSHLALTTSIVEDLEKALQAAVKAETAEMEQAIARITKNEREADALRRKVTDEVSQGELPPTDRVDLIDLIKRVDMVADWSRESTRILAALPLENVQTSIKDEFLEMVKNVKECANSLAKCVNRMMNKSEEALQAADEVEREEEKVDDLHEKARILIGKEDLPRAGVAILLNELFESLEMIADACEDACDQIRVIMVRK